MYKLAGEIVTAQAGVAKLSAEEINELIQKTCESLKNIKCNEEGAAEEESAPAMVSKKYIKQPSITCLECGKTFKVLTKRHFTEHDLTPKEYRAKYGFKAHVRFPVKPLGEAEEGR